MAGPIPTKKIPQLTAYGAPLAGAEMLEIWAVNTSRRVTARDFVLPIDSLITLAGMGGTLPGSRQLVSSPTIQVTDNGAGNTVQLEALGTGALPGNPTALVGLAPVNGVAVSWMRSDAAPALDQGINPTWTGDHEFAGHVGTTGTEPEWRWSETDAAANNRVWSARVNSEQFSIGALNDLATVYAPWVAVDRTDAVIDLVNITATLVQVNGVNVRDATNLFNTGTVPTARLGSGVAGVTSWLRGDQTWQALPGSFTGFANPTASIGLAAVNGVATTAMRSDAAPALDQGIAPTWTGVHSFTAGTAPNTPSIRLQSSRPIMTFIENDAAANNRAWFMDTQSEQLRLAVMDDAGAASTMFLAVDRTLNVVDSIALTSTALTWNGNPLLSTATAFANPTASIGLTAVSGAATTAMRSDAAPALSQAILPTWTGKHIFASSYSVAGAQAIELASNIPLLMINELDGAANNRKWVNFASSEQLVFALSSDTEAVFTNWLTVDRTTTVVDQIALRAARVDVTNPAAGSVDFFINDANSAADERLWRFRGNSAGQLQLGALADNLATGNNFMTVDRTGIVVDMIGFQTGAAGVVRIGNNMTESVNNAPLVVAMDGNAGVGVRNCTADVEGLYQASTGALSFGSRTAHNIDIFTANTLRWSIGNAAISAGSATPTLTANKPGANAGVAAWISVISPGLAQMWIPCFAN